MGVQQPNSTNYSHPHESHLLDLHNAMSYNSLGEPVLRTTSGAMITSNDAFGRLRVSTGFTIFESFHRYQDNGRIGVLTAVNGTSTHEVHSSSILMSVTNENGSSVIRESNRVFAYQPGKSLLMLTTFCMAPSKTGLRQRIGFFDVNNGIYLENDGGQISFVIRSASQTGSPQEHERALQADWNIDPLDGTGTSTKILNLATAQIMFIDVQWLGVGSSRVGFVIDGEFVPVHIFHHANRAGETTTYMGTACLPVRAEITNTAQTSGPSTYRQICTSIISEGGYELKGRPRSVGHALNAPRTISNQQLNTFFPMLSIRLKSGREGAIVIPINFSVAALTAGNYTYRIVSSAITSGGTWINPGSESSVEYNLTATSVTNGTVLEQGFIITSNQSSASPSLEDYPFKFQLERNTLTSPPTYYEFVIEVSATSAGSVACSVNWEEVT